MKAKIFILLSFAWLSLQIYKVFSGSILIVAFVILFVVYFIFMFLSFNLNEKHINFAKQNKKSDEYKSWLVLNRRLFIFLKIRNKLFGKQKKVFEIEQVLSIIDRELNFLQNGK